ncbi:YfhO family protein, partial [Staphylococcus arlettae]
PDSNFSVQLNQYQNNRLFNNSTYKTGVYTQLYRTQPDSDGNISIDISPYGTYQFQLLQLHGENYDTLKQATKQQQSHHYHDINNGVKVDLGKHESGMAQINIPYRQGMTAFVDGKKVTPQKVNYFMTGVPVRSNNDTIIIKYKPPFWFTMIIISLVSIVISVIFRFMLYKKSTIHKKKRG